MAKILFRVVVVLMLLASPALATERFADQNALMTWVTHYFQKPEPDFFEDSLKDAHELKALQNTRCVPTLIGFYAGMFQTDKDLRQPAATLNNDFPQVERHAILRGLRYSSKNDDDPAPLLLEELDKAPLIVDMLWGYFYATGDEAAVKRIILALPWSTMKREDVKDDKQKRLQWQAGVSAKRSLATQAARYQRVMEICKKELPGEPPEIKPILQEVINQAESGAATGKP
ncbi:MAG: hypothetical protein LBU39_10820 [Desulfobulbaceae bacterium]|jgi:hypothetical protein|nr:hypothetical protein [Desulfobulbaceae bacterium]